MTPEQFVYWLQGFMEMADPTTLTEKQTQQIKDHLALVFDKQTPDRVGKDYPLLTLDNHETTTPICSTQDIGDIHTTKFCDTIQVSPHMFSETKPSRGGRGKGGLKC